MNIKFNIFGLYIIFVFALISTAIADDAGKNGFTMLKMDVDGRAAAMGGAYTAVASDASAAFWNPAGLASSSEKSFVIMHNVWIADISQEFASIHFITGKHNIATSVNLMTVPGVEIRGNNPTENPQGKAEAFTFAASLSYATSILENWQIGLNLKYLYEKYYLEHAPGWAVDLGIRKLGVLKGLDWGLTFQNIGQMSNLKEIDTPLPLMVRSGIAYQLPFLLLEKAPLMTTDLQYIKDENFYFRLGSEFELLDYLTLRLGWISGGNQNHPTTGFSLRYTSYHFDYAFVPIQYDLGNSHRFSFGMNF